MRKVICLWYYIYLWIHLILFITRILECGLGLSHLHNHIRFQVTEILFYNEEWWGRGVSIIWTRKQIGPINFHHRFPVNVNYIHSDLQKVNLCYFKSSTEMIAALYYLMYIPTHTAAYCPWKDKSFRALLLQSPIPSRNIARFLTLMCPHFLYLFNWPFLCVLNICINKYILMIKLFLVVG